MICTLGCMLYLNFLKVFRKVPALELYIYIYIRKLLLPSLKSIYSYFR